MDHRKKEKNVTVLLYSFYLYWKLEKFDKPKIITGRNCAFIRGNTSRIYVGDIRILWPDSFNLTS